MNNMLKRIISDISKAQSQELDNRIRELCNTYGFEPEKIEDTPYRLVFENRHGKGETVYLCEIRDSIQILREGIVKVGDEEKKITF